MPSLDKKKKKKKSAAKSVDRKRSKSGGHHHRHRKSQPQAPAPPPPSPPLPCDSLTMLNWMMYTHKYGEHVYDAVQLILTCPVHRKLALCGVGEQKPNEDQKLYLPFYPIKHGQAWADAAEQFITKKLLRENLSKLPAAEQARLSSSLLITEPVFLELFRVQLPVYFDFNERVTYQVQLTADACQANLCLDNNIIGWYRVGPDLPFALTNQKLFGPEMLLMMDIAVAAVADPNISPAAIKKLVPEEDIVREFSISEIFAFPGLEELRSPKISKDDILRAYGDFLQHVSPSEFMVASRFEEYLTKANLLISSHIGGLYRAFSAKKRAFLDFEEFITGLLIIGRLTSSDGSGDGGGAGGNGVGGGSSTVLDALEGPSSSTISENKVVPPPVVIEYSPETMLLMAEFVYRFYASPDDPTHLNTGQLERAVKDCQISEVDLGALLTASAASAAGGGGSVVCHQEAFTRLLAERYLPRSNVQNAVTGPVGTFELVGERSPMEQLHLRLAYSEIRRTERDTCTHSTVRAATAKMRTRLLCDSCHRKHYTLAAHHVKLDSSGLFYQPTVNCAEDVARMSGHRLRHEAAFFRENFVCNQILDMIRNYAKLARIFPAATSSVTATGEEEAPVGAAGKSKRKTKRNRRSRRKGGSPDSGGKGGGEMPDWSKRQTKRSYVRKIVSLCQEVRELIASGPRVIKVASPCYVFGDIHGNLTDLLTYDMNVWRSNVYFFSSNLLFLGDYVDRGPNSVECVLYLLCMKAIAPSRVHLLRGNHETRQLQKEYTFYNEVTEKFGLEGGHAETIFDAFNAVFDVMPLVAIVDESIYCSHGGIPSQASLSQIFTIPSPLEAIADPSVANEILWNDPITDKEHADLMNNDASVANNTPEHPDGFPANTRRGTACYFSEYALRRFLTANNLSHVIRAHECIPQGYWFHSRGNCVTIFSCSHYANGINDAAIALIFNSQILVIKMDTISEQHNQC